MKNTHQEKIKELRETLLSSHKNWNEKLSGKSCKTIYEFLLYSDVGDISGQIEGKDYACEILNLGNPSKEKILLPRLVLRMYDHMENPDHSPKTIIKADESDYLNIGWQEQIAILLSLIYGIRIKAGALSRVIHPTENNLGVPRYDSRDTPSHTKLSSLPILPNAINCLTLDSFSIKDQKNRLLKYPKIQLEQAYALIQSANLYRDSMWLSENQTSLSWILLVSALETVALAWWKKNKKELSTEKTFLKKWPLLKIIMKEPEEEGSGTVDKFLRKWLPFLTTFKSLPKKKGIALELKFCAFILEYFPLPPPNRPPQHHQILWEKEEILKAMKNIYNRRSKFLHSGINFPQKMCESPIKNEGGTNFVAEKPEQCNIKMINTHLIKSDAELPMHLQTFNYLVRTTILNWFDTL